MDGWYGAHKQCIMCVCVCVCVHARPGIHYTRAIHYTTTGEREKPVQGGIHYTGRRSHPRSKIRQSNAVDQTQGRMPSGVNCVVYGRGRGAGLHDRAKLSPGPEDQVSELSEIGEQISDLRGPRARSGRGISTQIFERGARANWCCFEGPPSRGAEADRKEVVVVLALRAAAGYLLR